jgi:hypothetical protein
MPPAGLKFEFWGPGATGCSMAGEYGTMTLLDLAELWEPANP